MSDSIRFPYSRKRKPRATATDLLTYYPQSKRTIPTSDRYYEFLRHCADEITRLELKQNIPANYGIIVTELEKMRTQFQILNARVRRLESQLPKQVEIKDVPLKEARIMVESFLKRFLKENKQVYPSDVADTLGLKYETVREVFDALENEGKLKES
jgi:hypothetical protein